MKRFTLTFLTCIFTCFLYSQSPFEVKDLKYDGKIYSLMDGGNEMLSFQGVKRDLHYIDTDGKIYCPPSNEVLKCISCVLLDNKIFEYRTTKAGLSTSTFDISTCNLQEKVISMPIKGSTGYNSFISSPLKKIGLFIEQDGYSGPLAFHAVNQEGEILWSYDWDMKYLETRLQVLNTAIDDQGNAVFFTRATIEGKPNFMMLYRNNDEGKITQIPFELNISGIVKFECQFDKNGDIHFYGGSFSDVFQKGNKGFFYGKFNPDEDVKLVTKVYEVDDDMEFVINWQMSNFFVDEEGNTTLCAVGNYRKMGKGGYTDLFFLKIDKKGNQIWSKRITNINLMSASHQASELEYSFIRVGKNFIFLYYGNSDYLKYEKGIDLNIVDPEPKLNQLQYYLINEIGEISTGVLQDNIDFRFNKDCIVYRDSFTMLFTKEGLIKKLVIN